MNQIKQLLPSTKGTLRQDGEIESKQIILQIDDKINIVDIDHARAMVGPNQHLVEIGIQEGTDINGLPEGEYSVCIITTEKLAKLNAGNVYKLADSYLRGKLYESGRAEKHISEQIDYRKQVCKPCLENGRCLVCGCKTPGRFYSASECADNKYPRLMGKEQWLEWKNARSLEGGHPEVQVHDK